MSVTERPSCNALDAVLGKEFPVLDHGFIRVIDYMGNDAAIVQAARVSYGDGTKSVSDDAALIDYLMRHRHTSPFEHCEIKLHVKLPIFVARQWIRHRTASTNEYSARYSVLAREFYVPDAEHIAAQSTENRQGRETVALNPDAAGRARNEMDSGAGLCFDLYDYLLNYIDGACISRELARICLPLSTYTELYWKIDLHNLLHFLQLRCDAHAQHEIRVYADVMLDLVKRWVPLTHAAFLKNRLGAMTFSAPALEMLRRMLAGETVTQTDSGLGRREFDEVMGVIGI